MWLCAGCSARLTEEAADSTDAFTLLFSFHPRSTPTLPHTHTSTPRSTIRFLSVHQCVEGDEEKGKRVVLINGRKPDDGKERRETDRPP